MPFNFDGDYAYNKLTNYKAETAEQKDTDQSQLFTNLPSSQNASINKH